MPNIKYRPKEMLTKEDIAQIEKDRTKAMEIGKSMGFTNLHEDSLYQADAIGIDVRDFEEMTDITTGDKIKVTYDVHLDKKTIVGHFIDLTDGYLIIVLNGKAKHIPEGRIIEIDQIGINKEMRIKIRKSGSYDNMKGENDNTMMG